MWCCKGSRLLPWNFDATFFYLNYWNVVSWNKNHETHHNMQLNAMRSLDICLWLTSQMKNNTELALATRLRRTRSYPLYAGNSSRSNPGSGWRTNSAPWFSVVVPFLQFIPTASCIPTLPSPGDNHQSTGERSERTEPSKKMAAWSSFSYCSRALHSFRSCRAPPPSFLHCTRPT